MQRTATRKRSSGSPISWLIAFSMIAWIPALATPHVGSTNVPGTATHTVAQGESLWSIADRYVSRDGDVGVLVDRIVTANRLGTAGVHPGQHIIIPAGLGTAD